MIKKKNFLVPLVLALMAIGISAQNSAVTTSKNISSKMSKKLDSNDNLATEKLKKSIVSKKPSVYLEKANDTNSPNTENKKQSITSKDSQPCNDSRKDVSPQFTPNVTIDLHEPTVDYTIIDYKPRTSEAVSSHSVKEGADFNGKIKPIEDYSAHELLDVYQQAKPATQEKILANKVLKAKLISTGVDLNK